MSLLSRILLFLFAPLGLCGHEPSTRDVAETAADATRFNVVLILTDDQGYNDVGFNGGSEIPTPNLDRIANEGVRFTDGYVSYPVCGPSRAGLLTGRWQNRFGFNDNPTVDPGNPDAGIPLEERTIAEWLETAGYSSGLIGKWHMGSHPVHHPLNRGFDYFYGFLVGGSHYLPEKLTLDSWNQISRKWEWYSLKIMEGRERVEIDEYLTDEFSQAAVRFIDERAGLDAPFFLYLAYNAPHTPMEATEKYLSRFQHIEDEKRRTYAAMVSAVDDGVGMVLSALERNGVEENTLVIFLSDNGGAAQNSSDNTPLRGHKKTLFEGGVRVPFAVRLPGMIPQGSVFSEPVVSLDLLATILPLAGLSAEGTERPLDGVDLMPYLRGEVSGAPHDFLFWRYAQGGAYAVRHGGFKLYRAPWQEAEIDFDLFYLPQDLTEGTDLAATQPDRVAEISAAWETWNAQIRPDAFPSLDDDEWWQGTSVDE